MVAAANHFASGTLVRYEGDASGNGWMAFAEHDDQFLCEIRGIEEAKRYAVFRDGMCVGVSYRKADGMWEGMCGDALLSEADQMEAQWRRVHSRGVKIEPLSKLFEAMKPPQGGSAQAMPSGPSFTHNTAGAQALMFALPFDVPTLADLPHRRLDHFLKSGRAWHGLAVYVVCQVKGDDVFRLGYLKSIGDDYASVEWANPMVIPRERSRISTRCIYVPQFGANRPEHPYTAAV